MRLLSDTASGDNEFPKPLRFHNGDEHPLQHKKNDYSLKKTMQLVLSDDFCVVL